MKIEHPAIQAVFEVDCGYVVGRTEAPVKRIEVHDDGSYTCVIDHWPENSVSNDKDNPRCSPITLLDDDSAFFTASFSLPEDHWLYTDNEFDDDKPKPILTHDQRNEVINAIRSAIRGATMNGKDMDFDPDALVQNAVVALCGPYVDSVPL